ncbi:integrase [Serratia proteamaculans]|nr:integrase [Serratia proteamaculans]
MLSSSDFATPEPKPATRAGSAWIDRCRLASTTDFMLSAGIRKNSLDGSLHPDGLTKKFVATRKASKLEFEENLPTFHEIRSLAGRLYEKEKGKEFAQKLLGHESEKMTGKYLDTRGKEYVML